MRKVFCVAAALLLCSSAYALSAFQAAVTIREAVRLGDTATLERRVDWASVRQSLKRSQSETGQVMSEMSAAAGVAKPSLWQRAKAAAAPYVADPLIDRYVTADGAPRIWTWRQTWRQTIRPAVGLSEPPTVLAGTWFAGTGIDRSISLARRVDRVAFRSPTRLEVELRDRYVDGRSWQATLELRDATWMLTEVHIKRQDAGVQALRVTR